MVDGKFNPILFSGFQYQYCSTDQQLNTLRNFANQSSKLAEQLSRIISLVIHQKCASTDNLIHHFAAVSFLVK